MSMVPPTTSPWRMVVLDRNHGDPCWIVAEVVKPAHVWPAAIEPVTGRYTDWPLTVERVRRIAGDDISIVAVPEALAWHIRTAYKPRRLGRFEVPAEVTYLPPAEAEDAMHGILTGGWRR